MLARTRLLHHACLAAAPLALVVTLLAATPTHASVIYSYTGQLLTSVTTEGPTTPPELYTAADRVTGSIELAAPLAANLPSLSAVTPLSFSFSDGINTITNTNATFSNVSFATDAAGNIVEWSLSVQIYAQQQSGWALKSIGVQNTSIGMQTLATDSVLDMLCGPSSSSGGCAFFGDPLYIVSAETAGPGTWRLKTAPPVPEPSSMLLIGAALAGFAARRRGTRAR